MSANSSVESSAACNASITWRISVVVRDRRAVLGPVRDVCATSAASSAASDMCAPGAGSSRRPAGSGAARACSWSVTSHRSCKAVATASAAPAASRQRRSSAFARCSPEVGAARRRRSGLTEPCLRDGADGMRAERLVRGLRVGLGF